MNDKELSQIIPNKLHPYEVQIREKINQISSTAYNGGAAITELEYSVALQVLGVLISYACQGQNIAPIELAREQIKMIPQEWLFQRIPEVANKIINFDDEWEYRRLLELIDEAVPQLLKWAIEQGEDSVNEEVREASEDYALKIK